MIQESPTLDLVNNRSHFVSSHFGIIRAFSSCIHHLEATDLRQAALASSNPAWKSLISDPPTDERISLITTIFSDSDEANALNDLPVDHAQAFIDVVDEVLSCSFTLEAVTSSLTFYCAK